MSEKPPARRRLIRRRAQTAIDSDEEDVPDVNSETRTTKSEWTPPRIPEKPLDPNAGLDDHDPLTDTSHPPSTNSNRRTTGKTKQSADGPPSTKRRRIVAEDEEYGQEGRSSAGETEEESLHEKRQHGATVKSLKDKGGKGKGMSKKPPHDCADSTATTGNKRPRTGHASISEDAPVDVVGDEAKPTSPTSPPTKKRKLPAIKKIKQANTGPTTAPAVKTPTVADPIPPSIEAPKAGGRAIAAKVGVADFDLRDASVYAKLFGQAAGGNSTPRSGLSRREKEEERRRELNKMRDEAKAKRVAEALPPFDLAQQTDKIVRYEEKLRAIRSNALYPNFLAAKWRERWEQEKEQEKRSQRKEGQTSTVWDELDDREEGEVNGTPNHL